MYLLNLIFKNNHVRMSVAELVFAIFHCEEKISHVYAIDIKL